MNKFLLPLLILLMISCKTDSPTEETPRACSIGDFLEIDGIAVIEMEKDSVPTGWDVKTEIDGFTGDSYIQWAGDDFFGNPGNGLLTYKVHIETPGTYRFNWRSRIAIGDDITEHNDNWMKISNADDFFATQGTTSKIYPHGSGKSPNPEGAGSDGWFKVYMNTVGTWKWDANTSDNDAHQIYATFDQAGTYTILVSGRSNGHAVDRMVLYHQAADQSKAQNIILEPSVCTES